MNEEDILGLDSLVLFFMKPILLQECLSLRTQETTNVSTEFACGVDLSAERLGKAQFKKNVCFASELFQRGEDHSLF